VSVVLSRVHGWFEIDAVGWMLCVCAASSVGLRWAVLSMMVGL